MARGILDYRAIEEKAERKVPLAKRDLTISQPKGESKRRSMSSQGKALVVHLSEEDWSKLLSLSTYLGIAPSILCRAFLRQEISRCSLQEGLDGLILQLTNPHLQQPFLSHREMEVLNLMIQGISNRGIASILEIGGQTVKNHVTSILRKMKANSRTHAVVLALRHNLAEPRTIFCQEDMKS